MDLQTVNKGLKSWHPAYAGSQLVYMPAGWKNKEPEPYTFIYVNEELTIDDYIRFVDYALANRLLNPRMFTPRTFEYASLFHPVFYSSAIRPTGKHSGRRCSFFDRVTPLNITFSSRFSDHQSLILLRTQSVIFLAGVTLSAALIQNRWSVGTIESKLTKIWEVADHLERCPMFKNEADPIRKFVLGCVADYRRQPVETLKQLKLFYATLLKKLTTMITVEKKTLKEKQLSLAEQKKFGFISHLRSMLRNDLLCVIVYGSSVTSEQFADYDLIVVVKDLPSAMKILAGTSPAYGGVELNISLFSEDDFWSYQLASGDNLSERGVCLFGEIEIPHKAVGDLVLRNFSFGFIRFRQQVGMAMQSAALVSEADDKRNLLDYFIKIPLNVYKGIAGCLNQNEPNEKIMQWAKEYLSFDVGQYKNQSHNGYHSQAIAASAWATQEVMHYFNHEQNFFTNDHRQSKPRQLLYGKNL